MPSTTKYAKLQINTKTSAQWTSTNPVLLSGEIGLESDTLRMKIGNGNDRYSDLQYTDADLRSRIEALESFAEIQLQLMSSVITNNEAYL